MGSLHLAVQRLRRIGVPVLWISLASSSVAACASSTAPPRCPGDRDVPPESPAPGHTGGERGAQDGVADERGIGAMLDAWHEAAAHADEAAYFAAFTEGAVFLGTDAKERWDLEAFRAFARPYFARGRAWSFRATARHVTVLPGRAVAYFDETLATPNLGPARGSGVLLRRPDGRWLIAQYNLALTIPNEQLAAVRKLLEGDARDRQAP